MIEKHKPFGPYERFFKRPLDFLIGMMMIILGWWLYVIIAILVRVKLGKPVIFKQARPGKDEKIFHLYKFRTMTDEKDENGELLPDEKRLTAFGRFLRSTSLDELPEAINIIKGDMSLIGPRPLLVSYLPYYTEEEKKRHDVRPGLSGLAQVNGRNAISWDKKLAYDVEYVSKITFLGDIKIIFQTILKTIKRSDIQVGDTFVAGKFIDQRKERLEKEGYKEL